MGTTASKMVDRATKCVLHSALLIALFVVQAESFSPTLLTGFRSMTPASLSMGHLRPASWKCGARGLRAPATDADTQAVNWDEMLSKPWGSVDTDFMYFSECKA